MPTHVVHSSSPDLLEYLDSGNLIYYGAADIGKSTTIESSDNIQHIEQLSDLNRPLADTLALDDIYCLFSEYQSSSNQELKTAFEEVLSRENGICLATRPRSLDWLLCSTSFSEYFDVSEAIVLVHQYNEDEAVSTATSLVSDLSPTEIQDQIGCIEYSYDFEHDSFEDYSTFVPQIVLRSSALGRRGSIFPRDLRGSSDEGVLASARGFAARLSESIGFSNISVPSEEDINATESEARGFLTDFDRFYQSSIQPILEQNQDEIQAATVSLISGLSASAVPIVGPLLVGALIRPDGTARTRDATVGAFGELLSDELLPTSRCTLEEEMGVPPMTIEYLRQTTRPEFHSRLSRLAEADIEHVESVATQARTEIERLQTDLSELSDRISIVEAFISDRTQGAIKSHSVLRSDLVALEQLYLQVSGEIPIDDFELQGINLESHYQDILTGSSVHINRGPHGSGKTTLSYRLCKRFADDGFEICIPRLGDESRSFVKAALKGIQAPIVVYASYRVGAFSVDDSGDIIFLLRLVDEGVIDKLLIECRDEVYGHLNDEVQSRTANERVESDKAKLWRFKQTFRLPRIDEDGIRSIAHWVGSIKEDVASIENNIETIVDISGQNAEIAKIASRMICEGDDLSNIQTEDELIWHDIQNLTSGRNDEFETAQRSIVKWLAVSRGMPRGVLLESTGVRQEIFREAIDELSRYCHLNDSDEYQLVPDVYQEIIFREEGLRELERYVQTFTDNGMEDYLVDIALNITICSNIQDRSSFPNLYDDCLSGSQYVLKPLLRSDSNAELYYRAIETLSTTDLPISVDSVVAEKMVAGIVDQIDNEATEIFQRGSRVHTTERPEDRSLDVFSHLIANHVLVGEFDSVNQLFEAVLDAHDRHQEISPNTSGMLHYRGDESYDHQMGYLLECVGGSFERIAEYSDFDQLPEIIESIQGIVLSYQNRVDFPFPDQSPQTQSLQISVLLYSQAIAGVASVENDTQDITTLLAVIHDDLREMYEELHRDGTLFEGVSLEDWLIRVYAQFIKSLLFHHEFDLVDNWPNAVENKVNETFSYENQCKFYKFIVEWAAVRAEMEPRPGWLIWILSHPGILQIAVDEETEFMCHQQSYDLMNSFFAACLGVTRRIDLPQESAELNDLLDERTEELDENYAQIYRSVAEELISLSDVFRR